LLKNSKPHRARKRKRAGTHCARSADARRWFCIPQNRAVMSLRRVLQQPLPTCGPIVNRSIRAQPGHARLRSAGGTEWRRMRPSLAFDNRGSRLRCFGTLSSVQSPPTSYPQSPACFGTLSVCPLHSFHSFHFFHFFHFFHPIEQFTARMLRCCGSLKSGG
jgi:hypothetical protein